MSNNVIDAVAALTGSTPELVRRFNNEMREKLRGWSGLLRLNYFVRFEITKGHVNEYVRGTIFTKQSLLKFFHQDKIIKVYRYKVTKPQNC